ncbi:MAG TPA: hypothetical protein VKQ08_09135, partial [Cyclobacteriaceae bacterium]|nr:hypothetical protein [Cyclobacteriaceae bacterium]
MKGLDHLSENEIQSLIDRYYKNEKTADLLDEFKLTIKPTELVKLFPPKSLETKCPYCSSNMVVKYRARGSFSNESPECPVCKHKEDRTCWCKGCREKEIRLKELEREQQRQREEKKSIF